MKIDRKFNVIFETPFEKKRLEECITAREKQMEKERDEIAKDPEADEELLEEMEAEIHALAKMRLTVSKALRYER